MKTETLEYIYSKMLGENSIFVKLRMGEGINLKQYLQLEKSINTVIKIYENKENIPKELALCFLDITNHFYSSKELYSKEKQDDLEDMILNLQYLGERLFL